MDLDSLPKAEVVTRPANSRHRDNDDSLVAIDAKTNKQVLATTYGNYLAGAHKRFQDWRIVGQHPALDPPPLLRRDRISIQRRSTRAASRD